jgi:hypothetical protein
VLGCAEAAEVESEALFEASVPVQENKDTLAITATNKTNFFIS